MPDTETHRVLTDLRWHMNRGHLDEYGRTSRYADGDYWGTSRYLLVPDTRHGWVLQFVSDTSLQPWLKQTLGAWNHMKPARQAAHIHAQGRGQVA